MSDMTKFNNHPPINFANAKQITGADNNPEWGHDCVTVMQGKKVHLFRSYNSGRDYGHGTCTSKTYLGGFESPEALRDWLLSQTPPHPEEFTPELLTRSELDSLLEGLGYSGTEA